MPFNFPTSPRPRHFWFAALVGGIAVIARAAAQPVLGDEMPFLAAFPAMAFIAFLWGPLPALLTATVCGLGIWLPTIPPVIAESRQPLQFGWYAASSVLACLLCGKIRAVRSSALAQGQDRETQLSTWLKAVLWGAMCLPLSAFVGIAWWSLDRAEAESRTGLAHASELAFRQAERTMLTAQKVVRRAAAASEVPRDQERAREQALHVRLSDLAAGLTSVLNSNLFDASGSFLASSERYPVDPRVNVADRPYFKTLETSPVEFSLSDVLIGRHSGREIISLATRRRDADGGFNGVATVSLAPDFFVDYYKSLANENPALASFALLRADGAILARWPDASAGVYLAKGSSLMQMVADGAESGAMTIEADAGRGTQMVMFRRVGAMPLYVIAGVSRTAMITRWARFIGILAAIVLPTTAGLVYVSWVALSKTRKEEASAAEIQEHIRARAAAERRMLEAQKLETLSFLTGSVAHDFNNLLAVISSSLHVHKKRRPDTADDRALAAIDKSVKSGVRLTRQLLSFSKKQALRPEPIQFQTWLPTADMLMRTTLGSTADWNARVDEDTRVVSVDPGELELAIINLVLNAKLAMPDGGELSMHISNDSQAPEHSPMVIVCVVDSGEGIPPDVLPKVLEPFFTTRQKGVGSGLGLSQVHGFCVHSGGHMTIESTVGKGTTVCLHLPALRDAPAALPGPAESENVGNFEAHILLVEDNEDVARTTEQMLLSSGLTVVRVDSAGAALDHLATTGPVPDVVLSDIAMPGSMNGIGLAIELRRLFPGLPVMLNTGYAEQIEEARARGFRVLHKPVSPEVLLAELKALVPPVRKNG